MNLNTILTEAIAKGAMSITRKPIAALRGEIADLKRQVAELKRLQRALQKGVQREAVDAPAPEAETGKPTRIRPTGLPLIQPRHRLCPGVLSLLSCCW